VIGKEPTYEVLWFYKNTVCVLYDDEAHIYYKNKVPQDSVTTVLKVYDKSDRLVPWAAKVAMEKLLRNLPVFTTADGRQMISAMPYEVFLTLAMDAKSAHKDRLDEAASVGKEAHSYIEAHIKYELGRITQMPDKPTEPRALSCCNAALDWMKAHNIRWLQTERKIYSREYEYTGTMDGLCYADSCGNRVCCHTEFKDRLSLADWKTSNYMSEVYRLQVAAYKKAWQEEFKAHIEDCWVIKLGKEDGDFQTWHIEAEDFDRDFEGYLVCLELTRTMRDLKGIIKESEDAVKEQAREAKRAEKETAKRLACPKSKTYKGSKISQCMPDGTQCAACASIYATKNGLGATKAGLDAIKVE
jgi:hypothetical protein